MQPRNASVSRSPMLWAQLLLFVMLAALVAHWFCTDETVNAERHDRPDRRYLQPDLLTDILTWGKVAGMMTFWVALFGVAWCAGAFSKLVGVP